MTNKRSVDSEPVSNPNPEVKFNAFGQVYHVRLQPNRWLLRQGLVVERVAADGTVTEEEIQDRDCYYFAHLLSHSSESAGALSTCNGLRGLISHDDTDIYIAPLKDHHAMRYRREIEDVIEGEQAHIVYKRTSRTRRQTTSSSSDDYIDDSDDNDDDSEFYSYDDQRSDFRGNDTYMYNNDTFCEQVFAPVDLPDHSFLDHGSVDGGNTSDYEPNFADRLAADQEDGDHSQEGGHRYIEVFVIIDDAMVRHHRDDVMNYSFAIMNIVSRRYIDPSLNNEIRMAIVKLAVTETQDLTLIGRDGRNHTLTIHGNGPDLVDDVCGWANILNPASVDDPLHFDNTILMTSLNLYHDPDYGCENGRHVMSSMKVVGASSFKWSHCSATYLALFLNSHKATCLLDMPSTDHPEVNMIPIDQLAGTQYDRLYQCKKAYGSDVHALCGTRAHITCGQIGCNRYGWCLHIAAMEGTSCGKDMWCYSGHCRSSIGGIPDPIDGGWGEWAEDFTPCSRTCGTGVTYRRRPCDNPAPRYGGKACEGPMYIMHTCNENPCPGIQNADDYRRRECSNSNSMVYKYRTFEWTPDTDGNILDDWLCALKCQARIGSYVLEHNRPPYKVSGGTKCWSDEPDELRRTRRCVNNECKEFGCDRVYESGKLFDSCGVCEGTGRTCKRVHGALLERMPVRKMRYWRWMEIPVGVTGVNITNNDAYNQGLVLMVDGRTIFRPTALKRQDAKRFTVDSMLILLQNDYMKWEKLWILSGPTTKPIALDLLNEHFIIKPNAEIRANPTLFYEWYEPISEPVSYYWVLHTLTECSVTCEGGNQTFQPVCVEDINGTRVNVSDIFCKDSPVPSTVYDCNTLRCPGVLWMISDWGQECSVTCGQGVFERFVECVEGYTMVVKPTIDCIVYLGYRPDATLPCSLDPCPTVIATTLSEITMNISTETEGEASMYGDVPTNDTDSGQGGGGVGGLPPFISIPNTASFNEYNLYLLLTGLSISASTACYKLTMRS
ncbi:A disintegrin and metalloproteinase with thrombospondin motifs 18-like isoform X3 [Lytechinus variegatus]|uniref:A disintegrin and metalloproteinase with thrombospondin motifs 18-like isoform X3 n=1 Tax=Lytechinus variegatus TaxID=7654 RepID=UPI001BB26319|nr:A disintegrin and metalloproteinase with thrombospondin motifs 18-like isoform X3 [Lytechinus variegatus]